MLAYFVCATTVVGAVSFGYSFGGRTSEMMCDETIDFLGCQLDGQSVVTYSYTSDPWQLLVRDVWRFFVLWRTWPYIVFPVRPSDSGNLGELAPTRENVFCLAVHGFLVVAQLAFIVTLPCAFVLPLWMGAAWVGVFLAANRLVCQKFLNSDKLLYESTMGPPREENPFRHEQWVFLNGVAVGEHWMVSNLNRLALTFGRPVLGIHNRTHGIIFDTIECLIQRNFTYATSDVRMCYAKLKEMLYDEELMRIIFILHSQGGIEGGLVLDWLIQELPQDLLQKLEVYTFGCAANHFNNPHRSVLSQRLAKESAAAAASAITADGSAPSSTSADRVIGHIEHYAHTSDFVARWGVLHFASDLPSADAAVPRYMGRVFARTSPRGGHQFCQHYLDGMFPLERDPAGKFVGALEEGNHFMESEVSPRARHDCGEDGLREGDVVSSNAAATATTSATATGAVLVSGLASRRGTAFSLTASVVDDGNGDGESGRRKKKVKELSRLWGYINGRSPADLGA